MKIAIVLTVRNEERLLRQNLLYHHAIGVEKVYIYFDNTTDNGKESIKDLQFVEVSDSVSADNLLQYSYLEKFMRQADEHHTARQCLNIFDASIKAEKQGFDWLISLDADELIATGTEKISDLKDFFSQISADYNAVKFPVKEVLQAKKFYQNVFAEETLFKSQPRFKRYFQNIFKKFYDPVTGKHEKYIYWYGHQMGKMAIRLNKGLIPFNVHRFTNREGEKPKTTVKGLLLHYHSFDSEDFVKKYKNFKSHPNTYLSGRKVEKLKMFLIEVVNHCRKDNKELEDYFEKNLMFQEKEIQKMQRNRVYLFFRREVPVLTEITSVQKVFQNLIK
ncbi:glycosyltransferase family 2 protein [Salinimicrobium xinjiangense]|uniref:glycosyltransferase family 2 protein n=1 Tax=Salinimicrobium xinjiangense TaxID=438596 RepID=UPI00040B0ED1|nr:glycosyltransferase family 2 protein [Salinimicrobium xinjiangense]